jgi:hypothetical protein
MGACADDRKETVEGTEMPVEKLQGEWCWESESWGIMLALMIFGQVCLSKVN